VNRRDFLLASTGAATLASFGVRPVWSAGTDARIEIILDEPIATIAPEIYGHFTEHLGGVVYDGIWVGPKSAVPNVGGIRKALVEKMRQIRAPVIRWPGGCFADSYDWRDGIGAPAKRPVRTNFWEGARNREGAGLGELRAQIFESNAFGTDEFIRFCKLSGAEPYIAANVRSLPPLEFDRWIEYCNSPRGSTTLARQRAVNGSPDAYDVRYWGVGNESWGCGGSFLPEEYAEEFRRFATWTPHYGVPLEFIGSGPNGNDLDWTRGFFDALKKKNFLPRELRGWSVHNYTWNLSRGKTDDWVKGKGDALDFAPVDWFESLAQASSTEKIIIDQWGAMATYDPGRKIKLVVDEYGAWYRPGTELDPSHLLGQQVTMRDALITALTLDIFNRHADKVGMAACAQLINCLNALFFSHGDKFILSPVFYVFDLYAAHQGGQSLRVNFDAAPIGYDRDGSTANFPGIAGSASLRDKTVTLTCINPDPSEVRPIQIALRGQGHVASARGMALCNADIHAHNSFASPNAVQPVSLAVAASGEGVHCDLPPASVVRITAMLA
jgi:alpha-L-arabinofuranosidase